MLKKKREASSMNAQNLELIDRILAGELSESNHQTLEEQLTNPNFIKELLAQIECDEILQQHLNSSRSTDAFCKQLFKKDQFIFRDSEDFIDKVMGRIEAAKTHAIKPQPMADKMAKSAPHLHLAKIQEFPAYENVARAFARRRLSRRTFVVVAALALAAVGLSLWLTIQPVYARLDSSTAGLRVQRQGKWVEVQSAMSLFEGDVLTTQGPASLLDRDGKTSIELQAQSQLRIMKRGQHHYGAHYQLIQGRLRAVIAPQSVDAPMSFTTRQGRVVVLGTIIQLYCSAYQSKVEVEKGRIRWDNMESGESTFLSTGESQEISSIAVNYLPADSTPKLHWKIHSNGQAINEGECIAPAQPQTHRVFAQAEVVVAKNMQCKIKPQKSMTVKYRVSNGKDVFEGNIVSELNLVLTPSLWKIELWADCPAGAAFMPKVEWMEP